MYAIPNRAVRGLVAAALAASVLAGCSGGSGSAGTPAAASSVLKGNVIDGYVKNAAVTVYSDSAMTQQIGSGTTDANGNFSVALTVSTAPSTVYLKTEGGTNIDTGMPAPTLFFAGSSSGGSLHVSPITNVLAQSSLTQSLSTAQSALATRLGLTTTDLYGDPVSNATLQTALDKTLASGTQKTSLAAGSYKIVFFSINNQNLGQNISTFFSSGSLALNAADATISSSGDISGTGSGGEIITGKVQGDAMLLNITDSSTAPTFLSRIAGTVGLFGDVSGNQSTLGNLSAPTPSDLSRGVFVAAFVPTTGVDTTKLTAAIQALYQGQKYRLLAHEVFGKGEDLGWGDVTFNTIDAKTAVTPDISLGVVTANSAKNATVAVPNALTLKYNALNSGVYSFTSGTTTFPADIVVIHYNVVSGTTTVNDVYVMFAPGNRQGIYVKTDTSGVIQGFGNVYLARSDAVIPSLQPNKKYDLEIASVGPWVVGLTHTQATSQAEFQLSSFGSSNLLDTSALSAAGGSATFETPGLMGAFVMNGSMIAAEKDDNGNDMADHANGLGDSAEIMELAPSGAMTGMRQDGGCAKMGTNGFSMGDCATPATTMSQLDPTQPGVFRSKNWPEPFVAFPFVSGATTPSAFSGHLTFLARALYADDYTRFKSAFHTGEIEITAGSGGAAPTATMTISGMTTAPATMKASLTNGMYHIEGVPITGGEYFDIYWPLGGTKALYLVSTGNGSTDVVKEVGEAYISR